MNVWVVFEEWYDQTDLMRVYAQEHRAQTCVEYGNNHLPSGCNRYYYEEYDVEDTEDPRPY